MRAATGAIVAILLGAVPVGAAEPPALARARLLYNASDFDGAIVAADQARTQPGAANAAALVDARARLERYRRTGEASDLSAARQELSAIQPMALSARDQVDFLVGLGQALYLGDLFGAAVELFDTALQRGVVPPQDRAMLLDWWATAVDRSARSSTGDRRSVVYEALGARMEEELRRDPGSVPANYWHVVAKRGTGDIDGAWDAAVAAWVRAALSGTAAAALRVDIDRFVIQVLIPARVRVQPVSEQAAAVEALHTQWETIKQQYGS